MSTCSHRASTSAAPRLVLHNLGQDLVRARLLCAGVQAWDVWLTPGGRVTAPCFPPATGVLQGRLIDRRDQVSYEVCSPEWPMQGSAELLWRQVAGLPCLDWTHQPDPAGSALQVHNRHRETLQLALQFSASPYRLKLGLAAGSRWRLDPSQLSLLVVAQGVSAHCPLAQGHGHWTVQAGPGGPRLVPQGSEPPTSPEVFDHPDPHRR